MEELKRKLQQLFGKNKQLKSDLTKISQEMYRRNIELAEINKTLSLLQTIDTLVLGSDDSLASLCQKIARAMTKTTGYAFVGVLPRPNRNDNDLVLYGWSIQDESLRSSFNFSSPPHIKLNRPWFSQPERSELLAMETWSPDQMAEAFGCSTTELQSLTDKVPIKSLYNIKLIAHQKLVGMIMIGFLNGTAQLTHADTILVDRLSDSVGIALDNKLLFEENRHVLHRLQQEYDIIEHTVEVRTKELRSAQEKLRATDEMKTEFIILTSHNLRTPLTILHGNVELLEVTGMTQEQTQSVAGIKTGVERLKQFIDELLAISSIEAGTALELEQISIKELLSPLIAEARKQTISKGLSFNTLCQSDDTIIKVNIPLLREAIRNLLNNAIKFTSQGSITLSANIKESSFYFVVADTGIGIASEKIPNLFTKFHRGTDTLRYDFEGKGLGLFFTKLVVEAHGGKIEVTSTPNKGSEFQIIIPMPG